MSWTRIPPLALNKAVSNRPSPLSPPLCYASSVPLFRQGRGSKFQKKRWQVTSSMGREFLLTVSASAKVDDPCHWSSIQTSLSPCGIPWRRDRSTL